MIRNTIVALVLLLSAASVNAALIPIQVEVIGSDQGYGVGTYNSDTTEILFTYSGTGCYIVGCAQFTNEVEILGSQWRERTLSCAPLVLFCVNIDYSNGVAGYAFNTVNEFGSGTVSGELYGIFPAWASGSQRSYSISPVPLPAAAWLLGSALIGLAGVAKRRKVYTLQGELHA